MCPSYDDASGLTVALDRGKLITFKTSPTATAPFRMLSESCSSLQTLVTNWCNRWQHVTVPYQYATLRPLLV